MSKFWKIFTTIAFAVAFVVIVLLKIPTDFKADDYILFCIIGLAFGYMFMLGIDIIVNAFKNK